MNLRAITEAKLSGPEPDPLGLVDELFAFCREKGFISAWQEQNVAVVFQVADGSVRIPVERAQGLFRIMCARLCKISNDLDPALGDIYKGVAVMPYAAGSIRIECENTLPTHYFRLTYEQANKRPALDAADASCLESESQSRRASEARRLSGSANMRLLQQQSSTMGSRRNNSPCHLLGILWLVLAQFMPGRQPAIAGEPQYEVRGFMQQTDTTGKTNHFCDFWVAVSGKRSLIKVLYFNGESFVCGTDGVDTYLLNEMLPATRQNGAGTFQFADISAGPFPRLALSPVQTAWLAFASGGSLRKHGNKLPMEFLQETAAFTRNEVVLSTSPPHLPRSMKWWGPNFRVVGSQKEHQPLLAYPEGYLAATYSTGPTTNFGGNELPLQWNLAFYLPDFRKQNQIARREDVAPCGTLAATVTNVSPLAYRGNFLPSLGAQPVEFVEHRLEKETGQARQYPIVNGVPLTHWPGRDDPRFKQLARDYSLLWRLWWSVTGPNYRRGLLVVGAAGFLAGALCLFYWSSREKTL